MFHYCLPTLHSLIFLLFITHELGKETTLANNKTSIMTQNCLPKHENPLKAATVLISGPQSFKYCMCCIYWTKNIKAVFAPYHKSRREMGTFSMKKLFRLGRNIIQHQIIHEECNVYRSESSVIA